MVALVFPISWLFKRLQNISSGVIMMHIIIISLWGLILRVVALSDVPIASERHIDARHIDAIK